VSPDTTPPISSNTHSPNISAVPATGDPDGRAIQTPAHGSTDPEATDPDPDCDPVDVELGGLRGAVGAPGTVGTLTPTPRKSGAIGLPARRAAVALALWLVTHLYSYFSLKMIVLIREISVRIS
jgi:hypothetical protein